MMDAAVNPPLILSVGDLIDEIAVRLDAPWRRGSDAAATITRRRGGSAANVAVAVAAAGGRASFLGAIGDDATGAALEAALLHAGVEPRLQREGRSPTIIVIVEPDGERTMLPDRGVAMTLRHPGAAALQGVNWLHAPAYSLFGEPLATTTTRLFAEAKAAGAQRSIDASSVGALEVWGAEESRDRLHHLDAGHLFANEEEADYLDLLRRPLPNHVTILKRGAGSAEVRDATGNILAQATPAPLPSGIDSTGAGDAFAGGLLVARSRGATWEDALIGGHESARRHLLEQQHRATSEVHGT
jgi:sugar/nucleoside kinase (ribokinase family)